jgi:hypothetical protein
MPRLAGTANVTNVIVKAQIPMGALLCGDGRLVSANVK